MERGRTFYITLVSGLIALVLLLVSVNLPAQFVFETKPYALVILRSGKLDGWTAAELGLSSAELDLVKNNYQKFLSRHKPYADDSSESSSSSDDEDDSDDEDNEHLAVDVDQGNDNNNVTYHISEPGDSVTDDTLNNDGYATNDDTNMRRKREDEEEDADDDKGEEEEEGQSTGKEASEDSSSSSSSSDEGESSDSVELTLEQRLEDKPMTEYVGLGLFHGTVCSRMKDGKERCKSVSVNEVIYALNNEVSFMQTDINMPMWNNLRVESLFSVITCFFGLVCLFASLRPCCESKRLPVYLGAISFFASGALVFIPIVRILLVRTDLEQNIVSDYNVTLKVLTSWSLVASGVGIPCALIASFALIATKWYRVTKHWYQNIRTHDDRGLAQNGAAVEMKMTPEKI